MASFNKVILIGNLTRDVELTYTPKGIPVGKIGLAVNRHWTTEDGEKREEVTFVDITFFSKQAETLAQYIKKGAPLFVEGRLKLDQWEDKQTGKTRTKLSVIGESFRFLDRKKAGEDADHSPRRPTVRQPDHEPQQETPIDDDVPF